MNNKMDDETRNAIEVQLNIYDTYRKYVIHQDNVINYRMTWLLTIHGFLYATYGFTLQKTIDIIEKISESKFLNLYLFILRRFDHYITESYLDDSLLRTLHQMNYFLMTIIFVGFFISFVALGLVIAASRSSINLIRVGDKSFFTMTGGISLSRQNDKNHLKLFPIYEYFNLTSLTGGGSTVTPQFGRCLQYLIPGTLILSWIISGIVFYMYGLTI